MLQMAPSFTDVSAENSFPHPAPDDVNRGTES